MAGVKAKRDGRARGVAHTAVGAEDQDLLAAQRARVPTHAGVLAPSEQIAGRAREQHLGRHGERARGAGRGSAHVEQRRVAGIENRVGCHQGFAGAANSSCDPSERQKAKMAMPSSSTKVASPNGAYQAFQSAPRVIMLTLSIKNAAAMVATSPSRSKTKTSTEDTPTTTEHQ